MERALPEHRAQPGKIVIERIENAEPVAAAVDFQAFDGGQPIVRLDKRSVRVPERFDRRRSAAAGSQRAMRRCNSRSVITPASHGSVEVLLGLERLGVNFVEGRNPVVPLEQSRRRADPANRVLVQLPDRIDHRMVVRVENIFLEIWNGRRCGSAPRARRERCSDTRRDRNCDCATTRRYYSRPSRIPQSARSTTSFRNSHSVISET